MVKDYGRSLSELVSIQCPLCKSDNFSFKKPHVSKGSIVLPCTCSDCKTYFTVMYKAYEIQYNNGSGVVSSTLS